MSLFPITTKVLLNTLPTQKSHLVRSVARYRKYPQTVSHISNPTDHMKFGMQDAAPEQQLRMRRNPQNQQQQTDDHLDNRLQIAIQQLEEDVHRIPPFSCRDIAEMVVPLGFLGGSIMYIINDFTNKDGLNGKTFTGNVMTCIASIAGTGLVLHNWLDRWRRQREADAQRRSHEPIAVVVPDEHHEN